MKQEVKDRLMKCSKIAIIIGGILLWIVSFIGISAYSVYWLQQNINYEKETTNVLERPKLLNSTLDEYYAFKIKSKSYITTPLSYDDNTNGYKSYYDIDFDNRPQSDSVATFVYAFEGDFYCRVNNGYVTYSNLSFRFDVYGGQLVEIRINEIRLSGVNGGYTIYNSTNDNYNETLISFAHASRSTSFHVIENQDLGIIKYYFESVFYPSESNLTFNFESGSRNLPIFLSSYSRLQYGQVILADDTPTWGLKIPMIFECNGILYDNITLLYYDCFFYYNSAGQVVDNYSMFYGSNMNFPHICRYVLFGLYGKTLDYTLDSDGNLDSVNNGVLAMFMPYSGTHELVVSENVTWHLPVYQLFVGLQVNSNYSTIRVNDADNIPFINSTGVNLLPYNNISIRQILSGYFNFYGDVAGYNGFDYDVGLGNVFVLISDSFQSLIPLLSIQIIPGITLGLLVMLPLVVTIILVILKLVKK